jgi:hypothetical protein
VFAESATRLPISIRIRFFLELDVHPEARDEYWATVLVVTGIPNVLKIRARKDPSPEMCGVISFDDSFTTIRK